MRSSQSQPLKALPHRYTIGEYLRMVSDNPKAVSMEAQMVWVSRND
jgi:hypothetical protein